MSSLICAGQITREQALREIQEELYPPMELKEDKEYAIKKLGLTKEEFQMIMELPLKTFWDYPSYEKSTFYNLIATTYKNIKRLKGKHRA